MGVIYILDKIQIVYENVATRGLASENMCSVSMYYSILRKGKRARRTESSHER